MLAIRSAVSGVLQETSPSLASLLSEAWRLEPFVPPFKFSAFFSPEDTLLCVCAAESARQALHASSDGEPGIRIAELTSGSGLVGMRLLLGEAGSGTREARGESRQAGGERRQAGGGSREAGDGSTLLGLDVDPEARVIAAENARVLGVDGRARFVVADLWSPSTLELLRAERPQLLVCNPPYVPEPPGRSMELEAGAGPHGTAHLLRTLDLARELQPDAMALSWCSLSDPVGIVTASQDAGYDVIDLYVTAIADGEYSGSVHDYLRSLSDCYINDRPDTLRVIASDGAARFVYLLFSASFARRDARHGAWAGKPATSSPASRFPLPAPPFPLSASLLTRLCDHFADLGIPALASELDAPWLHRYVLNRWDELQLRVMLHGIPARATMSAP